MSEVKKVWAHIQENKNSSSEIVTEIEVIETKDPFNTKK